MRGLLLDVLQACPGTNDVTPQHGREDTALTVYTYNQAAAITGLARRTLERLIALGKGPAIIELSPRRRGILESDLITWLHKRRRPASSEAPRPLSAPLLNQFADGNVRPGSRPPCARREVKNARPST